MKTKKTKRAKLRFENINPNDKADFEIIYKKTMNLVAHLENQLSQLCASYKAITKSQSSSKVDCENTIKNQN